MKRNKRSPGQSKNTEAGRRSLHDVEMIGENGLAGIIVGIAHTLANADIATIARQPEKRNLYIDLLTGGIDLNAHGKIARTTGPALQNLGGIGVTEKNLKVDTEEILDGNSMLPSMYFNWVANYAKGIYVSSGKGNFVQ